MHKLAGQLGMSEREIRSQLEKGDSPRLKNGAYKKVYKLAELGNGQDACAGNAGSAFNWKVRRSHAKPTTARLLNELMSGGAVYGAIIPALGYFLQRAKVYW